jgi:hypothetical protein
VSSRAHASGFLLDKVLHGAYRSRIVLTEGWRQEARDEMLVEATR